MRAPPRAQCTRSKGWRKDPAGVMCTRPGPLGNPYPLDDEKDRQEVVDRFEHWARTILARRFPINPAEERFLKAYDDAKNASKLYCYCRLDQPCHVDVIRKLMEEGL